jgi:hypothetical protein
MEILSLMCEDFTAKWRSATSVSQPELLQTRYGPIAVLIRGMMSAVISGWLTFHRGSLVSSFCGVAAIDMMYTDTRYRPRLIIAPFCGSGSRGSSSGRSGFGDAAFAGTASSLYVSLRRACLGRGLLLGTSQSTHGSAEHCRNPVVCLRSPRSSKPSSVTPFSNALLNLPAMVLTHPWSTCL